MGIKASTVGQGADDPPHSQGVVRNVDTTDACSAVAWPKHGREYSQTSGFSRAVWTQQTGNLPVPGTKTDLGQCGNFAECLAERVDLDHGRFVYVANTANQGPGPAALRKIGIGMARSRQPASMPSIAAASTNACIRSGTQPTGAIP